jgi:pimeloyl-ACP methyl ester carboxylesterase
MALIHIDNFSVEFVAEGAGPTIILVHSSASGWRQWRRLIDDLKSRYRVIAVNLFGYGATSPWPNGRRQTLADQAKLVAQVAARADGQVFLVGHSLGGAVAMEAALHLGERLRGLIVFEPILFALLKEHGHAPAFSEVQELAQRYCALGKAGDWDQAGELFVDYWSGKGAWSAMSDDRKAALRRMLPNVVHEWDAVLAPAHALPDWGEISQPVHILRAADTRQPTLAVAGLLTSAHGHWTLHEFERGGHMAPVTHADMVNPVIAFILATMMT